MGNVERDPEVEKRIRSMCKNYMDLMSECCVDNKVLEHFKANKHAVLNEKVGMKIPEDVHISLDITKKRWATLPRVSC